MDRDVTASHASLGRFELLRELGRGGMGQVWLARDLRSGEQVALKRLHRTPGRSNDSRLALFEREYHMLAQLDHPHIVRVHDYGVEDGGAYYTMELLPGADLHERGKLPWRELCAVVRDLASALALVHSRRLVHRDLTPRNVRFTAAGTTRLIDFGALSPMGMCREVVGTPPFVAPELLNATALHGRSDLYALGALMYVTLSGRHAYPARNLRELRDHWRTRPPELSAIVPDVPPALSALVMSLLSLDETLRPRAAAEVIERVSAIAGLPRGEDIDFGRAFITTPKLIGRDDAIATIRRHVLQGRARRGTTLLIEGEPGLGRSRLLEHCALEGKLAGAIVLRAFASDGGRGDYGVLQALSQDLLVAAPEIALLAAQPHAEWLVHALPDVSQRLGVEPRPSGLDGASLRQRVQHAVFEWLAVIGRRKHLLLLVDDLQHCDEPSAAVLAALARRASSLAVNVITDLPLPAPPDLPHAVQLLASHCARIKLRPLSAQDFTAIVRSLFGDVPGMDALVEHLHGLCGGVPSAFMALAEHLVETGRARYDRGEWVLPSSLDGLALPSGVRSVHERRLLELDSDCLELCQALALADGGLPLASYAHLTSHGDPARLHAALGRLVAASVLTGDGQQYAFAHPGLPASILAQMPAQAAAGAHERLYRAHLELGAEPMRLAYHALYGGNPALAARLAIDFWQERLDSDEAAEIDWPVHMRETIEPLVAYCEREGKSPRDVMLLRQVLVLATMWADPGYALQQGRALDASLRRDVGLVYWDEVGGDTPLVRLSRCFERAQLAYDAAPPETRGLPPLAALQRLARHVLYGTQCASFANHAVRMRELCELIAPLAPALPALRLIDLLARAALLTMRGLSDEGGDMLEQVLERLEQPDVGLPDSHLRLFRLGVLYGLGLVKAKHLDPRVMMWADELATHALHQTNAWRLRKIYHLHEPDLIDAARCQERIEMHALQLNRGFWGNTVFIEAWSSGAYGDFQGLKHTLAVIEHLAERFPEQAPSRDFARALQHLLGGDAAAAEPLFAGVYETCGTFEDYFRLELAQAYRVLALIALGRAAEGPALMHEVLARLPSGWAHRYRSEVVLALCEAETGAHAAARERTVAAIADLYARRIYGAHRIMALECAARVAVRIGDAPLFEEYALELSVYCTEDACPSLRTRHAALIKEAQRAGLQLTDAELLASFETRELQSAAEHAEAVREAFDRCQGPVERSACALSLLARSIGAAGGFLYALRAPAELDLIACSPGLVPPAEVVDMVRARLAAIALSTEVRTEQLDVTPEEQPTGLLVDQTGAHYQLALLSTGREASDVPAGVAVLKLPADQPRLIPHALLQSIALAMFEAGDVTAVA